MTLPARIDSLKLTDYRLFASLSLDLTAPVSVLIAPNGYGKTASLDTIAMAINRLLRPTLEEEPGRRPVFKRSDRRFSNPSARPTVSAQLNLNGSALSLDVGTGPGNPWTIRKAQEAFTQLLEAGTTAPLFSYFRADRTTQKASASSGGKSRTAPEYSRAMAYDGWDQVVLNTSELIAYFESRDLAYAQDIALRLEESETFNFDRHRDAEYRSDLRSINQIIGGLSLQPTIAHQRVNGLHFSLRDHALTVQVGNPALDIPFASLSSGWRSVIMIATELARRASVLNPHLGGEAARLTPGVVLIDEIDLHLHPAWQQVVLSDLQSAFPLLQFIVSTHSPIVLSGVPEENVQIIDVDSNGVGTCTHPRFSEGAEAGLVMETAYGVPERAAHLEIVQDLHRFRLLVAQDEFDTVEGRAIWSRLEEWGAASEPEVGALSAEMAIRRARAAREQ